MDREGSVDGGRGGRLKGGKSKRERRRKRREKEGEKGGGRTHVSEKYQDFRKLS